MKIGVIADTHVPERADGVPEAVARAFKGVDMIIHAGDLTELAVLDSLKRICPDVRAVRGNMDPERVGRVLPDKLIIKAGRFTIGVAHGYGSPKHLVKLMEQLFAGDRADLVIFGHSHQAENRKEGGTVFFNPGSATDTVFAPYKSVGIVELDDTIKTSIIKLE